MGNNFRFRPGGKEKNQDIQSQKCFERRKPIRNQKQNRSDNSYALAYRSHNDGNDYTQRDEDGTDLLETLCMVPESADNNIPPSDLLFRVRLSS